MDTLLEAWEEFNRRFAAFVRLLVQEWYIVLSVVIILAVGGSMLVALVQYEQSLPQNCTYHHVYVQTTVDGQPATEEKWICR